MTNHLLYLATVLIWGSTWLAITYQLGVVPPEISVAYRFAIAAVVLFLISAVLRRRMRFTLPEHGRMALLGLCLFSVNYVLVYFATEHLTSGLVAVAFSTIVLINVFNGALFLGTPVERPVVLSGLVGLAGIALVFWHDLQGLRTGAETVKAIGFALAGTLVASLGNMVAAGNHHRRLPVLETNAFGMAYGAVMVAGYALLRGLPFTFDASAPYVVSLLYLALVGSAAAFGAYVTLLGRIGPARAAYASVLFPIVALVLSTMFEGYRWSAEALAGVALVTVGNVLALRRARAVVVPPPVAAVARTPDRG
jgi:drug/metabolite transporter (DMT)-like permease